MTVYGTSICIDCRNWKGIAEERGIVYEYVDITANTTNLKAFLRIRDTAALLAPQRENGGIGIPLFVHEDGRMTLDLDEALAWLGQPPVRAEQIRECGRDNGCTACS